jgi:putative ABC transport system permease protein
MRPLQDLIRRLDSEQALTDVKTMSEVVDDASARWRVSTSMFLGFGVVAVLLALTGLFSITSFTVAQRTREIAIRLALGDSQRGIIQLVMRSLGVAIVFGTISALALAVMIGRVVATLLYRVQPMDSTSLAVAVVGFSTVVLLTGIASASKASRIEPRIALQAE